jgi:hypothetical protein
MSKLQFILYVLAIVGGALMLFYLTRPLPLY